MFTLQGRRVISEGGYDTIFLDKDNIIRNRKGDIDPLSKNQDLIKSISFGYDCKFALTNQGKLKHHGLDRELELEPDEPVNIVQFDNDHDICVSITDKGEILYLGFRYMDDKDDFVEGGRGGAIIARLNFEHKIKMVNNNQYYLTLLDLDQHSIYYMSLRPTDDIKSCTITEDITVIAHNRRYICRYASWYFV